MFRFVIIDLFIYDYLILLGCSKKKEYFIILAAFRASYLIVEVRMSDEVNEKSNWKKRNEKSNLTLLNLHKFMKFKQLYA